MIVFKDAEKYKPKKKGTYLCIVKGQTFPFYERVLWDNEIWKTNLSYFKVIAFSETPPEIALKGISEDPEEDKCSNCGGSYVSWNTLCRDCTVGYALLD